MSAASGLEHLKPFLLGLESTLEDSEVSEIIINGSLVLVVGFVSGSVYPQ